jgi:hypothetical protein
MRYLIAVIVLLVGATPSYAAGCAVWRDLGHGFIELVNVCLDPEVRALIETQKIQGQRRIIRRSSVSAARRYAPYVSSRPTYAKGSRSSTSPEVIFVQEVPARPPTQAELEALVTSGPEPGKTWGIPVLPRVGEIR